VSALVDASRYAGGNLTLAEHLHAAGLVLEACPAIGLAFDNDAFGVTLPPLRGGTAAGITADVVRMFAAMYLHAELEQAGVLIAAELLGQSRYELPLRDAAVVARLEAFDRGARRRLTRDQRDYLFARVFGLGRVGPELASSANPDFMRLLLALCEAIHQLNEEARWGIAATGIRVERVRIAAATLVDNLSSRQFGNVLIAARQINETLREAIAILTNRGILVHFGAQTMWDVLRRIFGELTPDLGRLVTRGQSGMSLLTWIAGYLNWFARTDPTPPSAAAFASAAMFAAQWRAASGVAEPASAQPPQGVRA